MCGELLYSQSKAVSAGFWHKRNAEREPEVLLLSKLVTIVNPHIPTLRKQVLAFFDTGSQKSFLSQHVMKELKLKYCNKEQIALNVFGSKKLMQYDTYSVNIDIEQTDKSFKRLNVNTMQYH